MVIATPRTAGRVRNDWWNEYRDVVPDAYLELIQAEAGAKRTKTFNPLFIPGLLQTNGYATAITAATVLKPVPPETYSALVEVRMHRQREQLQSDRQFHLLALLDETVLYRPVGTTETMRSALDHLLDMTEHHRVTLRIIPRAFGPHPGQLGTYMLIEHDLRSNDLLFFETAIGNVTVRDRPDLVVAYQRLSDRLRDVGQSAALARELIASARDALGT